MKGIEVGNLQRFWMDAGSEGEELGSQLSGFNSPFWTLAMQDAKAVGEEGGDLGFNRAL